MCSLRKRYSSRARGLAAGDLVDDGGVVDGESGGVHAAEDGVEALLVLDVVHEFG